MAYNDKLTFLDEYEKLCKKYRVYIDIPYGRKMYLMSLNSGVDKNYELTIRMLEADLG